MHTIGQGIVGLLALTLALGVGVLAWAGARQAERRMRAEARRLDADAAGRSAGVT